MISNFVKPILLEYVLHTPKILKELISVTKLCVDNQLSIEFYPTYLFIYFFGCEESTL